MKNIYSFNNPEKLVYETRSVFRYWKNLFRDNRKMAPGAPFLNRLAGIAALVLGSSIGLLAQTGVVFEIINDSGQPDGNVYVKVPGQYWTNTATNTVSPASLFVNTDTNYSSSNYNSIPLTNLPTSSTLVSTITGQTNRVYTFQCYDVKSGQFVVSYGVPFAFTNGQLPNAAPNQIGSALRYDYAEFSIASGTNDVNNAVDLTYVDKFGIPLQLEWFAGPSSSNDLVNASYTYVSTKTLVDRFTALGLEDAVYALNGTNMTAPWTYTGPGSFTNFARIIGPSKISAGLTNSVAPYADASAMLNAAAANTNGFALNGNAPQGGYYYTGYNAKISTNAGGWLATLSGGGSTNTFPPNLPYTSTITFNIPSTSDNYVVYGSPVGPGFYSVNGTPVTNTLSPTYAVETWMIGDVLSALNFGFVGGNYGTNSSDWYSTLDWTHFPFGNARTPNDGMYNPFSALLYNATDGYGYAFSERITPGVLLNPLTGDTVRMTILPDEMLDAPIPAIGQVTTNSVALHWDPVAGATGYYVNVLRPPLSPTNSAVVNGSSYTNSGLQPGQPYVFTVQAMGAAPNGNPVITPARPFTVVTAGTYAPPANSFVTLPISFSTSDPYQTIESVSIGGTSTTNYVGNNFIMGLASGTNWIPVKVTGSSAGTTNNLFFYDYLALEVQTNAPASVTNSGVWYSAFGTQTNGNQGWFFNTNATAVSNAFNPGAISNFYTNTYAGVVSTIPMYGATAIFYGQEHNQQTPSLNAGSNVTVQVPVVATNGSTVNPYTIAINTTLPGVSPTNFPTNGTVIGLTYTPTSSHKYAKVATSGAPSSNTYAEWIAQFYTSAPNDLKSSDPDGDSSNNLLEYYQARNPSVPDLTGSVEVAATNTTNGPALIYSFRQSTDLVNVLAAVGVSTNLNDWDTNGLLFVTNAPGTNSTYTMPTYRALQTGNKLFLRTDVQDPQ